MNETIYMIASGDLRLSANQVCQDAQAAMESKVVAAFEKLGRQVKRAHDIDQVKKHGFIDSQRRGMEVFETIPNDAPLIVAEAVWQYSHHILAGLYTHKGPIITIANWDGTYPGLVGLLNANASMTKANIKYSTIWSEDFTDDFFLNGIKSWLDTGEIKHDSSHVRPLSSGDASESAKQRGADFGERFKKKKAIMGVFDECCMGMFNAIIPDELLNPTGIFKERFSQSALYAKMLSVKDEEAEAVYKWLLDRGMTFHLGPNDETDLTEAQILMQCRMYIAAARIADEFGCDTIGIQYQQGMKDLTPASDLAEGILNNVERPPVYHEVTGEELFSGEAIPHFNEVDECAGLDGLLTYRLWRELGLDPENTLHDVRWARQYKDDNIDEYVWVMEISGSVPPAHFADGYKGAVGERQPPMFFRLGGSTIKGVGKPGNLVWSRVYIEDNRLKCDIGLARAIDLPASETEERWAMTTPQWPIMHTVFDGISRDQFMNKHKSNHMQFVYAPDEKEAAQEAMFTKAYAMQALGIEVFLCGNI